MRNVLTRLTLCSALLCVPANSLVVRDDHNSTGTAPTCGRIGYDDGTASFWYSVDKTDGTYDGCYAACDQHSECKSFSVDPVSAECNLYNARVTYTFTYNQYSPYYYFDVGCQQIESFPCGRQATGYGRFRLWSSLNETDSSCIAACLGHPNCASYAFGGDSQCFLFYLPLTVMVLDTREKAMEVFGRFTYSNRHCIDSLSISTTASIATVTQASTTIYTESASTSTSTTTAKTSTSTLRYCSSR